MKNINTEASDDEEDSDNNVGFVFNMLYEPKISNNVDAKLARSKYLLSVRLQTMLFVFF